MPFEETEPSATALAALLDGAVPAMDRLARGGEWATLVDRIAGFIDPVEQYFRDVLVVDPDRPGATLARAGLVERLRDVMTAWFDIRELAGEAAR